MQQLVSKNGNKDLFKLISKEEFPWGGKADLPIFIETRGFNVGDQHSPTGCFIRTTCRKGNVVMSVSTTFIPGGFMREHFVEDRNAGTRTLEGYSIEQKGAMNIGAGR